VTPSDESISGLPPHGQMLYTQAQTYIHEIDACIERLDKVLARLQPPVSGRVRISWRKEGAAKFAQSKPVLVRWTKQGELWRSERLGLKSLVQKAPKTGAFYNTREEIREAVRELSVLLNRRAAIMNALFRLEQSIVFMTTRNAENMNASRAVADDLQRRAEMLPCKWKDGVFGEPPKDVDAKVDLENIELMDLNDLSDEERQAFIASLGQK